MINFLILLEYVVNLILLLFFYMHMFQLNSYEFKKQVYWMKTNVKKIVFQIIFVVVGTVFALFNNVIANVLSIIILAFSIIYNMPKGKSKISLKITNRVKRMFVTEIVLALIVSAIGGFEKCIFVKLLILNVIASLMCMIASFINSPIEKAIKKRYINQAKKILQDMPNLLVIGVTGSYGKTSVKNFLTKTLSAKYEVLTTPKNYNTTMGVVKTIRENLKPTHQIFVCEMGATNVGEIKEICDIVKPKIGVITAIGPQHLETFKSIDNIIKTKFELADSVKENGGVVFLNYGNEYIKNHKVDMKVITYGINDENLDYNSYNLKSSSNGLSFKMKNKENKEIDFRTKLIGAHNITNITAAIAVANYMGIQLEKLVPRVREIQSVPHRLQIIPNGNLTIIDDSYNSNPVSSKSALDTLSEFEGTKIIVTPGLIELGENEEKYNFELGSYMAGICDYIFLVGAKHSKPILDGIKSKKFDENKVFTVNTPSEAVGNISKLNISDKITVLLENDLPDNYNL